MTHFLLTKIVDKFKFLKGKAKHAPNVDLDSNKDEESLKFPPLSNRSNNNGLNNRDNSRKRMKVRFESEDEGAQQSKALLIKVRPSKNNLPPLL